MKTETLNLNTSLGATTAYVARPDNHTAAAVLPARKYNLPVEVVTYDADHAFFNDTRPEVYDPAAAADAWSRVLNLFRKHLAIAVPTGA